MRDALTDSLDNFKDQIASSSLHSVHSDRHYAPPRPTPPPAEGSFKPQFHKTNTVEPARGGGALAGHSEAGVKEAGWGLKEAGWGLKSDETPARTKALRLDRLPRTKMCNGCSGFKYRRRRRICT